MLVEPVVLEFWPLLGSLCIFLCFSYLRRLFYGSLLLFFFCFESSCQYQCNGLPGKNGFPNDLLCLSVERDVRLLIHSLTHYPRPNCFKPLKVTKSSASKLRYTYFKHCQEKICLSDSRRSQSSSENCYSAPLHELIFQSALLLRPNRVFQ